MKNRLLYFISIIISLSASCTTNSTDGGVIQQSDEHTLQLTVLIPPDEVATRITLRENEDRSISLTWRENDELQLCFVQGSKIIKHTASIKGISNEDKSGTFEIAIPKEITGGTFNLYGVYGGGGLAESEPSNAAIHNNLRDAGSIQVIQDKKDLMLVFSHENISLTNPTINVNLKHIGALFSITLKNNSNNHMTNIAEARLTAESDGWLHTTGSTGGSYNVVNSKFEDSDTSGKYISFRTTNRSLKKGENITFWGWYPILPDTKWPELKLELLDESGEVIALSKNTKPERREVTKAGKAYYFFSTIDEEGLKFTDSHFLDIDNFEINIGINVSSWLSVPKYTGAGRLSFFQEKDVELLSSLGFDHIRLCIDEVELWEEDGTKIRPEGFDLLHDAIRWCEKYGLRVIVDMHITRNHRFTNTENLLFTDSSEPANFVKLWEDLSHELYKYPNSLVAYELLNEPVSADPKNWNRVSALAINAIRAKEADRTIIVGVCTSNFGVRYNDLQLPSTHHVMMTFHFYSPFLLTYYGSTSTTGGRRDIPIIYPGPPQLIPEEYIHLLPANWQETGRRVYDRERLETSIMLGINRAKELEVPVFVGEFGTWNATPEPARTNWYRDIVDILLANDIPYTLWDYKGWGYSLISESNEVFYPTLVDIITRKKAMEGDSKIDDMININW